MFTGIIGGLGVIKSIRPKGTLISITVKEPSLEDIKVGDSISINGACLTATAVNADEAMFDVSSETRQKTTLGNLKAGNRVNIEKALKVGDKLGGHFVTGHIDGIGTLMSITKKGDDVIIGIKLPTELLRYVVKKGSISVDGISLTVADIEEGVFKVTVIPYTLKTTTLGVKKINDRVNIEIDALAKLNLQKPAPPENASKITEAFLKEHGLI